MKRMIAFIFVIFVLFGVILVKDNLPSSFDYTKVVVVSKNDDLCSAEKIQNGEVYYYFLGKDAKDILDNISGKDIEGIVYYLSNEYDIGFLNKKFDYTLSSPSYVEGREVYYGYDKDYYDFRFIDGKKINVQIANDGNGWIIGYPMILTGF